MLNVKRRYELSDRGVMFSLHWLVFLGLSFLAIYNGLESRSWKNIAAPLSITVIYVLANTLYTLFFKKQTERTLWGAAIFLIDVVLIGSALYYSVGLDADLFLICFLILYLSTLGRKVQDALLLSVVSGILYFWLLAHQNPNTNMFSAKILLRFPFFFILAFFTTYLSEDSERNRAKVVQLESEHAKLQKERDWVAKELDKKQAELIQAEKLSAMGHMAGALAHEIRNPLCVIIGYLSEMITEVPETSPHHKFLVTMERCANRCNLLVENLLRFSRLPKGEERFSINQTVVDALELARLGKKARKVQCKTEFEGDIWVVGRRSELEQVIVNLGTNAMDAMMDGGTLTVSARRETAADQDWLLIEVSDTGAGIPEALQKKIFDPFFTTKDPSIGTGLGLSIVRDIVRGYEGTLELYSKPGEGTTFKIRLPASRIVDVTALAA